MITLSLLAQQYEDSVTDKRSEVHNYLQFYDRIFFEYKDVATTVLEIGVAKGGSCRLWARYFEKSKIFGIDIEDQFVEHTGHERIVFTKLDQSNVDMLKTFAKTNGPFDIIIDDGSHNWGQQISSFETLWPFIKDGGTYVVEDVLTSYNSNKLYSSDSSISAVEWFKEIVDQVNWKGSTHVDKVNPIANRRRTHSLYQSQIDTIMFKTNLIVVKKIKQVDDLTW